MMKESDKYVLIGRVGKPHGIKGEVRITSFSGDTDNLVGYRQLFLSPDRKGREKREYQLVRGRDQGEYAIIALAGVESRDDAEEIRGYSVWIDREELPDLAENEFYWHDFEGKDVYTRQGERLGKVVNLLSTGPNDILVIAGRHGKEYMIPVCDDFVEMPEAEGDRIIVSPPEGLLNING